MADDGERCRPESGESVSGDRVGSPYVREGDQRGSEDQGEGVNRWRDYFTGFCQAFTLFPDPEDFQGYPHKNEAEAIKGDWQKVGDAMRKVAGELEKTIAEETAKNGMAGQATQAPLDDHANASGGGGTPEN